ncbi:hypothetical protein [Agrobacterium sp. a22-2]|uniref:hypothetical protein n=1 Tax=Agrobacterium sp. a22-2 TaxID=2283840 RepID=UPI001AED39E1|nr:hypothetical protein [Agrobacterium sp. a22-2]
MACMLVLPAGLAGAQDVATPPIMMLSGKCLRVIVGEQDMTAACSGKLGRTVLADGRSGFYFLLGQNHILTFSGTDVMRKNAKGASIKVDRLIFNEGLETNKPKVLSARGQCTYGNPSKGQITVRCSGSLRQGTKFSASFQSDGTPPQQP